MRLEERARRERRRMAVGGRGWWDGKREREKGRLLVYIEGMAEFEGGGAR